MSENGQIWCGICREWYLEEYKDCPDCRHTEQSKLEIERNRYKSALEEITTFVPSVVGDYPVKLTESKMFYIAQEALNNG